MGRSLRVIALLAALTLVGCSFTIQGPVSRSNPGKCERAAPGRKTADVLGLIGTGMFALAFNALLDYCSSNCEPGPGVASRVVGVLALAPPILYTAALVVGSNRTSACARAQDASPRTGGAPAPALSITNPPRGRVYFAADWLTAGEASWLAPPGSPGSGGTRASPGE